MFDYLKQTKIESMRQAYPSLRLVSLEDDPELVWEGELRPLRFADELDAILDDLEHDRGVFIISGECYEIRHHPQCIIEHGEHSLSRSITLPTRSFVVRVTDRGDGSLPQTVILDPAIPDELRKHFLGDGICAFAPWRYSRDEGVVSFVDHSLIWLFKWNVFSQTEPHVWIGSEYDHEPNYLLNIVKPTDLCWCGSAKNFSACHRSVTAYDAFGIPWVHLEVWLVHHNSNPKRFESIISQKGLVTMSANAGTRR
jgi:hypothetical protein